MSIVRNKDITQIGYLAKEIATDLAIDLKKEWKVIVVFQTIKGEVFNCISINTIIPIPLII